MLTITKNNISKTIFLLSVLCITQISSFSLNNSSSDLMTANLDGTSPVPFTFTEDNHRPFASKGLFGNNSRAGFLLINQKPVLLFKNASQEITKGTPIMAYKENTTFELLIFDGPESIGEVSLATKGEAALEELNAALNGKAITPGTLAMTEYPLDMPFGKFLEIITTGHKAAVEIVKAESADNWAVFAQEREEEDSRLDIKEAMRKDKENFEAFKTGANFFSSVPGFVKDDYMPILDEIITKFIAAQEKTPYYSALPRISSEIYEDLIDYPFRNNMKPMAFMRYFQGALEANPRALSASNPYSITYFMPEYLDSFIEQKPELLNEKKEYLEWVATVDKLLEELYTKTQDYFEQVSGNRNAIRPETSYGSFVNTLKKRFITNFTQNTNTTILKYNKIGPAYVKACSQLLGDYTELHDDNGALYPHLVINLLGGTGVVPAFRGAYQVPTDLVNLDRRILI